MFSALNNIPGNTANTRSIEKTYNSQKFNAFFEQGRFFFQKQKFNEAIDYLEKCILVFGESDLTGDDQANLPYVYDLLGQCYAELDKSKEALENYNLAIQRSPSCESALNNKGRLYVALGRSNIPIPKEDNVEYTFEEKEAIQKQANISKEYFKEAKCFILTALKLCKDRPEFLNNLGTWFEFSTGLIEYTIQDLKRADENINRYFQCAIIYYFKAYHLSKTNYKYAGVELFHAAFKTNLIDCIAEYGHYQYRKQRYELAIQLYTKALEKDPEHPSSLYQKGRAFLKQEKYEEARKAFSNYMNVYPEEDVDMDINFAWCYIYLQNLVEAKKYIDSISNLNSQDNNVIRALSDLTFAYNEAMKEKQTNSPVLPISLFGSKFNSDENIEKEENSPSNQP